MSARNHILSAREQNINKIVDCLPQINKQRLGYRSGRELSRLSANSNSFINRNIDYSFKLPYYSSDDFERSGTPYSDFFSESETGTPDFRSEESDSSAGSALNRNTAEATKTLASEWERIERTLYDEDGDKTIRPQIIEECKQWRQLHPQLRVIGKAIPLPEKRSVQKYTDHEEVIAMHYSDYEQFSESEERLSQSSTDVTPQNSPRVLFTDDITEPRLSREKISFYQQDDELGLPDSFCSLLQITPIQIRSPPHRNRQNSSILKSDFASSKWMRNSRPDSSNFERSSAKSFVSLDTRNCKSIIGTDNSKVLNGRVMTARHREMAKLEPLYTPPQNDTRFINGSQPQYTIRKVSLPPLLLEEERRKVSCSAKKLTKYRKPTSKAYLDKIKQG